MGNVDFYLYVQGKKHIKNIKALSEKDRNIEKYDWCYSINQWYRNTRPDLCIAQINIGLSTC